MRYVLYILKSLIAMASVFVTALIQATHDGSGITLNEWLIATGGALSALALVMRIPNGPRPGGPK